MADYWASTGASIATTPDCCRLAARIQTRAPARSSPKAPDRRVSREAPAVLRTSSSVRKRVHGVVDAEVKRRRGIVHRHPPFIDPFPELADVVVVIQHHLKITMSVAKAEKLHRTLPRENIGRGHVE